jgi:hypothetical protein
MSTTDDDDEAKATNVVQFIRFKVPDELRRFKVLAGAGRPPGSLNKTTTQLREAILGALEAAGGEEGSVGYLKRLAIENSSAFASLLGKVLPTTLAAASESDGGLGTKITFERVIVWPDGHREIEGVTPKALPAPDLPTTLAASDSDGGLGVEDIKRTEGAGAASSHSLPNSGARCLSCRQSPIIKKQASQLIAGVIASRKTGDQQQ